MKRLILSLMALLLIFRGLSAQNKVALGYCEDKLGGTVIAQDNVPHEFGAAIYLPSELLNKYAGSTINRIDFALGDVAGDIMTVFITRDLEGKDLCSTKVVDLKKGWNSVDLKNTYTIKEGDNLYVGYRYFTTPETVQSEVIIFDYSMGTIPGTNWYSQDNNWWKFDSSSIPFDLAIRAFAEGDNLPHTDVGARDLMSPSIIYKDVPSDYSFTMRNYGTDTVKSIRYNILANGDIYDTKELTGIDFPNNTEMSVTLRDISFPREGNNTLGIEITDVNGADDTDRSDNTIASYIYSIPEDAYGVKRNVLFEEYTTEKDASSISADSVYGKAVERFKNVIWVKHHLGGDKFFLDEEEGYRWLFEDNKTFYPAVTADRNVFDGLNERGPAYFVGHEDIVADLFKISSGIKSYVLPEVSVQFDSGTRSMDIDVDVTSEVCEMPLQKDLRLTVYIVEDGVASDTQAGADSYVQNGVIRSILTDTWGDSIDISSRSCSKHLTYSLPSECNEKNIRIVAFVNNYDKDNPANCMVYNSCQSSLYGTSGIDNVEGSATDASVWYDGHLLHVSDGYNIDRVYDVTGTPVNKIGRGLYIIRLTSDTGMCLTKKIMIK